MYGVNLSSVNSDICPSTSIISIVLDKSDAELVAPLVLASYLGGISTAMIVLSGKAMPWRDSNVNSRDPAWLVDSSAMGASYPEAAGPERPKDWHILARSTLVPKVDLSRPRFLDDIALVWSNARASTRTFRRAGKSGSCHI